MLAGKFKRRSLADGGALFVSIIIVDIIKLIFICTHSGISWGFVFVRGAVGRQGGFVLNLSLSFSE